MHQGTVSRCVRLLDCAHRQPPMTPLFLQHDLSAASKAFRIRHLALLLDHWLYFVALEYLSSTSWSLERETSPDHICEASADQFDTHNILFQLLDLPVHFAPLCHPFDSKNLNWPPCPLFNNATSRWPLVPIPATATGTVQIATSQTATMERFSVCG